MGDFIVTLLGNGVWQETGATDVDLHEAVSVPAVESSGVAENTDVVIIRVVARDTTIDRVAMRVRGTEVGEEPKDREAMRRAGLATGCARSEKTRSELPLRLIPVSFGRRFSYSIPSAAGVSGMNGTSLTGKLSE